MWLFVVQLLAVVFNVSRSEFIYSLYNISSVPPLDNLCGLSRAQILAAQQSNNVKKGPSSSPKRPYVLAPCLETECSAVRQRELIDCLTYEAIASQNLDDQLALNVRSLESQLIAAADDRERSTALLLEVANRMNAANCEYRESAMAADMASRQLAEQHEVVSEAQALVNNIIILLAEAKDSMTAYVQLKQDTDEFSVYAPGNRQKNNGCADGTGSGVVRGFSHVAKVDAPPPSPPNKASPTKESPT
ncbi:uncharacterized protein LOC111032726 [Myzus persicae]|uniref:uncharacterized protein LOC111032726 n=1 Tax=Myzus persicae TaxID=13164 RepID=UPI000B939D68|nr:uncharacterized protein LOC111032726 [Myzus persicae]